MTTPHVKLAALGLAAAAVLLAVWRLVGVAEAPTGIVEEVPVPEAAPELAVPATEGAALSATGGTREGIAARDAPTAEGPSAAPPVLDHITLFGSLLDGATRELLEKEVTLKLIDRFGQEVGPQTPQSGSYSFEDLRRGRWWIAADARGFRSVRTEIELAPEENPRRQDLRFDRADVLKVRLTTPEGSPLSLIAFSERTGASSRLRESSLHVIVVATRDPPGAFVDHPVSGAPVRVGIGTYRERYSGQREVRWTTDRYRRIYSGEVRSGETDALDGLPREYTGVIELAEPLPAYVSAVVREAVLQTQLVPPGTEEVSFTLSAADLRGCVGSVSLRVVDSVTGEPLRRATVAFERETSGGGSGVVRPDGTVLFARVLPGHQTLNILAEGHAPVFERVLVQAGKPTDLGTYRLDPCSEIRGKVVDQDGKPARVMMNVFPLDRYDATRSTLANRFFSSADDGEFKIDSVGRGAFVLRVCDPERVGQPVLVDAGGGIVQRVEIRVSMPIPVALRFRTQPPERTRVRLWTRANLPVAERDCDGTLPMAFRLAPGSYSIEVNDGDTWLWSQGLVVGTAPMEVVLAR